MYFADLTEQDSPWAWTERPDGVVLAGIVGAHAHGLADADAAADEGCRRGVFLASSEEFLGLDDVQETAENPYADEVLHELGRFVRQALKVNPALVDLLWLENYEVCTEVGLGLVGLRRDMLSAPRVRSSYLHTAASLLTDIVTDIDRSPATIQRMARLLICGYGLWSTGALQVRLSNPQWFHDFAAQVVDGDIAAARDLVARYEQRFADTESPLPDEPDRAKVDEWLRATRRDALEKATSS